MRIGYGRAPGGFVCGMLGSISVVTERFRKEGRMGSPAITGDGLEGSSEAGDDGGSVGSVDNR